jgi:hypothetical protein
VENLVGHWEHNLVGIQLCNNGAKFFIKPKFNFPTSYFVLDFSMLIFF